MEWVNWSLSCRPRSSWLTVSRQHHAGHPSYDDVTGRQSICRRRISCLEQPSCCHPWSVTVVVNLRKAAENLFVCLRVAALVMTGALEMYWLTITNYHILRFVSHLYWSLRAEWRSTHNASLVHLLRSMSPLPADSLLYVSELRQANYCGVPLDCPARLRVKTYYSQWQVPASDGCRDREYERDPDIFPWTYSPDIYPHRTIPLPYTV